MPSVEFGNSYLPLAVALDGLARTGGDGRDAELVRGRDGAARGGERRLDRLGLIRREDLQLGGCRWLAVRRRVVLRVGYAKLRAGLGPGREGHQGGGLRGVARSGGANLRTRRIGQRNARKSVKRARRAAAVGEINDREIGAGGAATAA